MNIGGMQMTDGATKAPSRMDDPPGTRRIRSARVTRRAGKVSLSTNDSTSPSDICRISPSRKPSRIPCLTQALTSQRPSRFSAARISPRVRAARKSRKMRRASSRALDSPMNSRAESCSMADCRVEAIRSSEASCCAGCTPLILATGGRVQLHHLAGDGLIFGLNHLEFSGTDCVAHNLAVREHIFGAPMNVFLNRGFEQVVGLGRFLGLGDGRINLIHDGLEVAARHFLTGASGANRPTLFMADDD